MRLSHPRLVTRLVYRGGSIEARNANKRLQVITIHQVLSAIGDTVLVSMCWWRCVGAAVLVTLCWCHCVCVKVLVTLCLCQGVGDAVLVPLCWWRCVGATVFVLKCWWCYVSATVLVTLCWCYCAGVSLLFQILYSAQHKVVDWTLPLNCEWWSI